MALLPFPWEPKETMRSSLILYVVLAALVAGCSGRYDRELLGDPEPAPAAQAAPDITWNGAETPGDTTGYEELIHTPTEWEMFGDLRPYGEWYETVEFGVVWRPIVPVSWSPYLRGHWIWTSYGWMWVSYDPFGWATFHYGTWWYDPYLAWIWIPDYAWSPAPVDWFYGDGYCGWAPLPPPGCRWDDPWNDYGKYKKGWVVIETGKFKEVDVGENHIPPSRFKDMYRVGTARRSAPDTRAIESATRQQIKETDIRFESQRFGGHELRKVILPSREQQIVDRFPTPMPSPRQTQLVAPPGGGGGSSGTTPAPQTKSKGSQPESKGQSTSPPKFKDRKGSSKDSPQKSKGDSKDNGENKDDGKSKNGESKDKGKDGGSPAKAKGKKG